MTNCNNCGAPYIKVCDYCGTNYGVVRVKKCQYKDGEKRVSWFWIFLSAFAIIYIFVFLKRKKEGKEKSKLA